MAKRKREFLDSDAWQKFRREYETADDRSCALLCAAYLDQCLEVLLLKALPHAEETRNGLFGEMMPLGTFNAKLKIAFCLNLYDDMFYSDLNIIRKIRNRFAHELHGLAFDKDPICTWCNSLRFPDDWCDAMEESVETVCGYDPRNRFIFTSALMSSCFESHYHQKAVTTHAALLNVKPFAEEESPL